MPKRNKHIGSSVKAFYVKEGMLSSVEAGALLHMRALVADFLDSQVGPHGFLTHNREYDGERTCFHCGCRWLLKHIVGPRSPHVALECLRCGATWITADEWHLLDEGERLSLMGDFPDADYPPDKADS